ncbi:mechanosensitive ion channel family protein [Clostridium sp. FAM 1755]|uniref:Mechanosensitive ion channel family protein n=1 Tax=Clostridium botulinum TaxID=1491 RepID=A0A6M0T1Y4_CLOBO|nr:mechanosensitive ion channel family protein [Clostridium sporogenes]NFA61778.1 mechanosensitive ion channel family protein [Clostridium botulinum]NFI75138.1 mechanosensitive ion channel family protein [Clostridium sporogenes]NFL73375.1 mechanosensitive ion channel family protein [Clostridium sporogenes]NFM25465.1 mechanosensitive ion channel family protein [Clostridium sporogenes]NFP63492.1 mechanosensitive ion channel family protein [Clostridium sporogenes]
MKSSFKFDFDLSKGGIKIGDIPIETESIYYVCSKIMKIIIIFILMYLSIKIGNKIINRFVKKQSNLKFSLDDKKATTVGTILNSILRYIVYFVGIFSIIEILFGRIGSIFAGLGGAAIGLGAKDLIKDVISGFFILFEDQFSVGDYITVEDKSGIVDTIELRVTKLKDFNGDLHIIPNGLINTVTNHAKNNIRFKVEINVAYEVDIEEAINTINKVCLEYAKERKDIVVEQPSVYGITSLGNNGISIVVYGRTTPMNQWTAEIELRKRILIELKNENIEIPYNKFQIIK